MKLQLENEKAIVFRVTIDLPTLHIVHRFKYAFNSPTGNKNTI